MPEWDGDHQSPNGKSDPRFWLWAVTVLTFLAVAIASGWMSGPIINADEGGYLLNAGAIAGKLRSSVILGSYYSGYSLFLAPAWMLFSEPGHIYHACLIINGLLLATVPAGLYWLLSALFPQSLPRTRLLAALAGAWQAPVWAISQLTFSENLLIPIYVWALVLLAQGALNRKASLAFASGAVAGYLFVIHPRGTLLAAPVLAMVATHAFRSRFSLKWISALIAGALVVAALHWPLEVLAGKHGAQQGANYDMARLSRELLTSFTWSRFVTGLVGVLVYALASTATFVALGMLVNRATRARSPVATAIVRGLSLAFLACALVTAIFFVNGRRIDYLIYGRYILPVMVPLVACGALVFLETSRTQVWLAAAGAVLAIALLAWMFEHSTLPPRTRWMPENVIGLYPAFRFSGGVYPVAIGVYFIAFFAIIEIVRLQSASTAIASFILVNLMVAAAFLAFQLQPEGKRRDQDRVLVRAVAKMEANHNDRLCVDISPALDVWHNVDYRFWLYRNLAQATDARTHCIHATIAPLSPRPPGAWRLVARAQARSTGLFIKFDSRKRAGCPSSIIEALPHGSH